MSASYPAILANGSARARAIRSLREWISDGILASGEPLPPERQLSRSLGVGLSTVQRALRSLQAEGLVRQGVGRTRIVGPARSGGASLVKNGIAVVAGSTMPPAGHSQPGWSDYIGFGAIQAIRGHGITALCLTGEEAMRELSGRSDQVLPRGLILVGPPWDQGRLAPLASELAQAGAGVVVYGDNPPDQAFDRVISDHEAGSYGLTKLLLARGRKRIIRVGGWVDETYWTNQRALGYERAMREAGLEPQAVNQMRLNEAPPINPENFEMNWRQVGGYLGPLLIRPDRPDALMAISDSLVPLLAAVCRSFSLEPQVDIDIVGYDHYWEDLAARQWEPTRPLATIDKKNYQIGVALAELLFDRLEGRLSREPQLRIVKPELVYFDRLPDSNDTSHRYISHEPDRRSQ